MTGLRIVLGGVGVLLAGYGAARLLHGLPLGTLLVLGAWLLVALLLHHGVLQPAVLAIGAAAGRVPPPARAFVQAALIMIGVVVIIALPLIIRQGSQPPAKAMLLQPYGLHLALLVGVIILGTALAYALRGVRERH